MELERVAKELMVLARKDELSPSDHQRARALMKELRKMAMTNAQIAELTQGRWAETTVKEYTRGVTAVDPQQWQSTTALLAEMLSKGLAAEDVRETIAVRDKLEGGGSSLAEITEFLVELKGAGIDVGTVVALCRDWKASGLTPSDAASALKYKGEIEEAGFGLGSLLDIAQAAKALGSPEEVLEAVGKYRLIAELDEQLKAAQDRLAGEESKIKQRLEAGEQAIKEVKKRERSTGDRLSQLDGQVNARAELLSKAEELEKLGLDAARLGDLCTAVTGISAKHGLGRQEALGKFFDQLKEYDASLGFEAEAAMWEAVAETKSLEGERVKAQLDGLEVRYRERKEAVDAMESLLKQGINPDQVPTWDRILGRFKGPEQFDQELERYRGIEELLKARAKEIERRELKVAELDARVKALKQELAEIQGSIRSLSQSGVREIAQLRDEVVAGLQALASETKRWGELKAEAGKLEEELRHARYLTADDERVLKAFPKRVVLSFLDRAATYCSLKGLNPTVRIPDSLRSKYPLFALTEVSLLDLIAWARAGLAGVSQ